MSWLLIFLISGSGFSQTKEEGIALYNEALRLQEQAQTSEDLQKAVEKYEQALGIFEKAQHKEGIGRVLNELGLAYEGWGQTDKALEYYKKSLAMLRAGKDRTGEARVLSHIGGIYNDWGEYERALHYYDESLAIAKELQDRKIEGDTLNNLGILYKYKGDYDKAEELCRKSLAIAVEVKNRRAEGLVLSNLGDVFYRNNDQYDNALECFTKSLASATEVRDRRTEGQALHGIGNVYRSRNQYDKAEEHFKRSLAIALELKDRALEAALLNNLGNVSSDGRKSHDQAVEYYEKALAIRLEMKDRRWQGIVLRNLGLRYSNQGQKDRALEYYEKALALKKELQDRTGEGDVLFDEAIALKNKAQTGRDIEAAISKYQQALDVFEKIQFKKKVGSVALNLGNIYTDLGKYDKAAEYYEKTLAIRKDLKDALGEGQTLNNLGMVYHTWGQNDKALECLERAASIASETKDPKGESNALLNLSRVYRSWGQYDKAIAYCEKSLSTKKTLEDPLEEAYALHDLGVLCYQAGQYDKALEHFEKVLDISTEVADLNGRGTAFNALGNVYRQWGQYEKAAECLEKALAILRDLKHVSGEGSALKNLGNVYLDWGQYDKAVECYGKSLAIWREVQDPAEEAGALNNLGHVYESWGQYDKAMENFKTSLRIRRNLRDKSGEAGSLSSMGITYAQMGQFEEALKHLQEANTINAEIGVPTRGGKDDIGNVYLDMGQLDKAEPLIVEAGYDVSLGRLHLLKAEYSKAADYYQKVRSWAEKNRSSYGLFASYTGLGMAFEQLGDNIGAEDNYHKAVDLTEEVRSSLSRGQREKFFDVKVRGFLRTAPYDGLARVLLRMGKKEEALKVSEYTKARIFAESMSRRSDSGTFDIPPEVKKQDEDLNNKLSALKKTRQEAYEKGNKLVIEAIEPQVKELEANHQAHIKMLRENYPLFAATKYPQPMDLEQTALNDNEWVLEYHVTDPGIIIYLSKGKQLIKALFKSKPRNDLENMVLEYRKPLEVVPGKDKLEEKLASFNLPIGKELSDVLLSDVLDLVPKGASIIIVPDDCLGTVPFEMLTLNDKGSVKTDRQIPYVSGAEFFGDRNLISYNQSVTALTLARTHSKGKAAAGGLLAIADPVFSEKDKRTSKAPKKEAPTGVFPTLLKSLHLMGGEGTDQMGGLKFPRLELTEELAEELVKNDKSGSRLCKGFDATKDNFLQNIKPSLMKYDKIVFATHGYFGKDLAPIMEPVLVLTLVPPGTDGFLRMTEVMGLDINAEIVALTACQTGLGTRVSGEGTMGMGRAFQYAGAKSVLMSLWSVSEVASVKLVKSFFQHIKAGKTKPEALELARSELRKGVFDHPFFWAGFILVGETN